MKDLREIGALSPNGAVVTDDSGGGQVVALNVTQKVLIDVCLPRHDDFPMMFFRQNVCVRDMSEIIIGIYLRCKVYFLCG